MTFADFAILLAGGAHDRPAAAGGARGSAVPPPPTRRPLLAASPSSSTAADGPRLARVPSARPLLQRQQSDAIRSAAAAAEDSRRRAAIRAYRRAVQGSISVSEAANFGDLVAVGVRGPKASGSTASAAAPFVTLTCDSVIRVNNTPVSAGVPPTIDHRFAGESAGSLAVAPRGILMTPGGRYYFEAEVRYFSPEPDAAAALSATPTFVAAIGAVPAGYNGGVPGAGDLAASGAAAFAPAGLSKAVGASSDFARDGAAFAVSLAAAATGPADKPTAAYSLLSAGAASQPSASTPRYRDVVGCGVTIPERGPAEVVFFLNGKPVNADAPARIAVEAVGTGLLPIVWVSSAAHNAVMPIGLRLQLGYPDDVAFSPLGKRVPTVRPTVYNSHGLPDGYTWLRKRLHEQLARTMITQAGHAVGQLIPTSGGSGLVIEAPRKPSPGAVRPRYEWNITGTKEFPSASE